MPVKQRRSLAIGAMLLSALSFGFMGVAVKGTGGVSLFQGVFFRNLIILILVTASLAGKPREFFRGQKENRPFLMARSFLGLAGVILYFYTLSHLNLADATMLNKLSPFFVTLFAALFLKEKLGRIQIPALVLAFIGAVLIIKPRFDLSVLPALTGLLSAVTAGGAYTLIRFMRDRENPHTIIFHFSLVSTLVTLPLAVFFWIPPSPLQWAALIGTGIFASGGQFFLTWAYQLAPAGEVSIYNYSHILFSGILGFLFFREVPDVLSLLGGALIVLVALGLYRSSRS